MGSGAEKTDGVGGVPRTVDECWSELLRRMAVPKHAGVYVLGCFARNVTFYSQQVRALNLIDALCKSGALAEGGSVAVVGAGLAGLTAAAAAVRRGLFVHLLQEDYDPQADPGRMPLQKSSDERWVDPFIYDWPHLPGSAAEGLPAGAGRPAPAKTLAGLPLLDWEAQSPSEVRRQVLESFRKIVDEEGRRRGGPRIDFHRAKVTSDDLERVGGKWMVKVEGAAEPVAVDVLVLAVGFGVEAAKPPYWENDGLGGIGRDRRTYLVSGVGDGGLTDVMRLCIAEFKHSTVLDKFKITQDVGLRLEAAVRERRPEVHKYFLREAAKIDIPREDEENLLASRPNVVYVTGSPEAVFGGASRASILNRLIVAWLFSRGRFKLVDAKMRDPGPEGPTRRVEFGRWDKNEADPHPTVWGYRDESFVETGEDPPREYDEVLMRHGPGRVVAGSDRKVSPLEECFPEFWEAFKEDAEYLDFWDRMPHWDDWTRQPRWEPGDFAYPPPPLDLPAGEGLTYLVVEHPATGGFVQRSLRGVIKRLHGLPDPAYRPPALDLVEDFRNPHRFGRAVRALCRAEIVVFDLTMDTCPEAYVLLGIRSVARRGITIVTTRFKQPKPARRAKNSKPAASPAGADEPPEPAKSDAPFAVPEMPFLLRDINFCGWGEEATFVPRLKRVIEEGRARRDRLGPIYRDLPAYEEVRQLGPDPEDHRVQGPEQVALFLSPLNPAYRKKKGSWLKTRFGAEETGMYIVESPSPEATSIKLYSSIRRTKLCVVDWTERKPNVFFEFGIRLAVSPTPPVCVIHKGEPWAKARRRGDEGAGGIYDLFRPLVYDENSADAELDKFELDVQLRLNALQKKESAAEWPPEAAALSPDFVYRQVKAATPVEAEDWNVPVWKELQTRANLILGSDPGPFPDPPILFNDEQDFKRRARFSGLDRLLAAWYFLERRHNLREQLAGGAAPDEKEEPWRSALDIGDLITRRLKYMKTGDYARMRDEVDEVIQKIISQRKGA